MTTPHSARRPSLPALPKRPASLLPMMRGIAVVVCLALATLAASAAVEAAPTAPLLAGAETGSLLGMRSAEAPCVSVDKPNLHLDLLADRPEVVPGEQLQLAVRFELAEHWHTYHGLNPGSIGLPTRVEWTLPEGFVAGPLSWPAPRLYKETSGDVSYVLEGEFVLVSNISVPAGAPTGSPLTFSATLDYQVCKDKCMRGSAKLDLTLPVVAAPTLLPSSDCQRTFEQALARAAQTHPAGFTVATALSHSALRPGDSIIAAMLLTPPKGVRLERPAYDTRPHVVFERLPDIEVEALEVRDDPAGMRILARVTASAVLAVDEPVRTLRSIVQTDVTGGTEQNGRYPLDFDVRFTLPIAQADASVAAIRGPLLDDVDVGALVGPAEETAARASTPQPASTLPLWQALFFAFVGGLILNVMPCVLPVLSLKALALVEEANHSTHRVHSFVGMYVLGVLASFWALAAAVITLKLSGEYVGWGFQFQEPSYVLVMTAVIFAFALSMFGVFEVPGITTSGESAGLKGSFVHGVLTTALSTPCSAPFLGPALAFALSQSPAQIVATFSLVGVGLAAPIAALTLAPQLRRFIPRPGAWMETFKHIVGFLLVGTAIWLLSVLNTQLNADAMATTYILLGAVSVGAWILGRWTGPLVSRTRRWTAIAATVVVVGGAASRVELAPPSQNPGEDLSSELIAWQRFDGENTLELARQGHTVFIDFTADWCATCKTVEVAAIETEAVSELILANGIIAVKADLTRKNPEISRWVEYYGRAAIPLYVILPAGKPDDPIILPEVITEDMLLKSLRSAGPSRVTSKTTAADGTPRG